MLEQQQPEVIVELLSDNEVEAPIEEPVTTEVIEEKPKKQNRGNRAPRTEKQKGNLVTARTKLAEMKRKEKLQAKMVKDFMLQLHQLNLNEVVTPEPVKKEPKEKKKPGLPKKIKPEPELQPVILKPVLTKPEVKIEIEIEESKPEPPKPKPLSQLEINRILKNNMKLKKKKRSSRR